MLDKLTTGSAYRYIDQIVSRIERSINVSRIEINLCDEDQIKKRIIQSIVEKVTQPIIRALQQSNFEENLNEISLKIDDKNFYIDLKTYEFKLSYSYVLRKIAAFFYLWTKFLGLCLVWFLITKPRKTEAATFLFEAGGNFEFNDDEFLNFCFNGPVQPLNQKPLIIQSNIQPLLQSYSKEVLYCKMPLIGYFYNYMSKLDQLKFLAAHLLAPLSLFSSVFKQPISAIIATDFVYLNTYAYLNKRNLIRDMVITNSSFNSQPLWMKGLRKQSFKLHMIWYSQNFIPKRYFGERLGSNLPASKTIRVDVHWVWTEWFRQYLIGIGQENKINVVGPLLWYLRRQSHVKVKKNHDYTIILFDVTPINEKTHGFAAIKNYYSVKTIKKFIEDCLRACEELSLRYDVKINVYLKSKRSRSPHHVQSYFDFLDYLQNEKKFFRLLNSNSNLYQLIDFADLSVAVPYTSTAYISAAMNKKAIYYDSSAELFPSYEADHNIFFSNNYHSLLNRIEQCLDLRSRG